LYHADLFDPLLIQVLNLILLNILFFYTASENLPKPVACWSSAEKNFAMNSGLFTQLESSLCRGVATYATI